MFCIINFALFVQNKIQFRSNFGGGVQNQEKYSRGWRGAPAKGVGRETGARVQIPLSPFDIIQRLLEKFPSSFCMFKVKLWIISCKATIYSGELKTGKKSWKTCKKWLTYSRENGNISKLTRERQRKLKKKKKVLDKAERIW